MSSTIGELMTGLGMCLCSDDFLTNLLRYPDIYDNYKKWKALRNDTWEEEMRTLEVSALVLLAQQITFTNYILLVISRKHL